jgi:predicted amidohydrolase YtcJ
VDDPGVERNAVGQPTGRLFRLDSWLARRIPGDDPLADVAEVSRDLAGRGVTGVTDATPEARADGLAALVDAVADGRIRQRVHAMSPVGTEPPACPLVSRGPHKVLLDDDRLPALAELVELVRAAHAAGTPVAVHCVTPAQLALAVAGFDEAGSGAGDRLEHASVVHPELVGGLAALGLTVVTNPGLVHARGDRYLEEVDARDVPHLYRCASLLDSGVAVAAGTDAPFGPVDPWTVVRAAHTRRTVGGRTLGADETVSLAAAVGLFTGRPDAPGRPRRIAPGEPGDLCLLADGVVPGPDDAVAATVVAGRVVYRAR